MFALCCVCVDGWWFILCVFIKGLMLTHVMSFVFRRGNIKSMSRNSSKTSIKLTLAFYNLQHVEQRSQRVNPTPHRGRFFIYFLIIITSTVLDIVLSLIFLLSYNRTNSSNGKDGWPTLSGHNKLANGLSEDRKSPPLLDYLDQEVITSDMLETELGPGQRTALSPFSSNCDSNR